MFAGRFFCSMEGFTRFCDLVCDLVKMGAEVNLSFLLLDPNFPDFDVIA